MKSKQSTPLSLIRDIANHNALCLWLRINANARWTPQGYNATIFDFTYSKLANRTKLSQSCCHKYLKVLIDKGYCYMHNGNLCCKGINQYNEPKVLIPIHHTKKQQILELRFALINQNLIKQKQQVKRNAEVVRKAKTPHEKLSKSELKKLRNSPQICVHIDPVNLSNKKFGKIVCLSLASGQRLQRQLNKAGLIQSISRNIVLVKNASISDYYHYRAINTIPSIRYYKGCIVQQLSNEIKVGIA